MDPIVSTESLVLMELALPARVRLPPGLGACVVATLLVLVFVPILIFPAAVGMAILMAGAISMHVKVKDELIKSLPAAIFLVLSLSIALL